MKTRIPCLRLARFCFALAAAAPLASPAAPPGCPPITITPAKPPDGTLNVPYSDLLGAHGGVAPYTFSLINPLFGPPPGLTLATSGFLSGIPTNAGTVSFDVEVTDRNGCLGSASITLTISTNSGSGAVQMLVPNISVRESAGRVAITVIRKGSHKGAASVDFATRDNTAVAAKDYSATTGTVFFVDGQVSATIIIPIIDNAIIDGSRFFDVILSNPQGGVLLTEFDRTAVKIRDNDLTKSLSFNLGTGNKVTVRLSGPGQPSVSLNSTQGIQSIAVSGSDHTTSLFISNTDSNRQIGSNIAIPEIDVDGPLKLLSAPHTDLAGSFSVTGSLAHAQFHDILTGAQILTGSNPPVTTIFSAHLIVDDAMLNFGTPIKSFTSAAIGDALITAPGAGSIFIKGDAKADLPATFSARLHLTGIGLPAGASALNTFVVAHGGAITDALMVIDEPVGAVSAPQIVNTTFDVGFSPANSNDPFGGGTFVPGLHIKSLTTTASSNSFVNSFVFAAQIGSFHFSSVSTNNNGAPFGIGGQSIKSLSIKNPPFMWNPAGPDDQDLLDFHIRFFATH